MSYNSHWIDKDTGYCFWCGDIGTSGYCTRKLEEPKMIYDHEPDPDTPEIRTPTDILAEEAAKVQAEQYDFRILVNKSLPRKQDDVGKVAIWGRDKKVYEPIITKLKTAGWVTYISYNNLCIEFPKG